MYFKLTTITCQKDSVNKLPYASSESHCVMSLIILRDETVEKDLYNVKR